MINQNLLLTGDDGYNLTNSLRFRSSASAYLSRTPAGAGNRRTFTYSVWLKRGVLDASYNKYFFSAKPSPSVRDGMYFGTSQTLSVFANDGSSASLVTTQVFRDVSAWYHIVVAVDTTQATASDRVKIYVNGSQVTAFGTATYPAINYDWAFNNSVIHTISDDAANAPTGLYHFDGYMAEINFIDGQALTPSSFGETSTTTGVWIPKKYTGTYGTNGFYLPFTDNSALTTSSNVGLGKDFSGNGNYFATNNISITAGVTYDSMTDVPTLTSATAGNYPVLNEISAYSGLPITNANIQTSAVPSGNNWYSRSTTMGFSSGKIYAEFSMPSITSGNQGNPVGFGIIPASNDFSASGQLVGDANRGYGFYCPDTAANVPVKRVAGSNTSVGSGSATTTSDIFMVAFDLTNGNAWFGKNGTWYAGDPAAGTGASITGITAGEYIFGLSVYRDTTYTNNTAAINFGQRPFTYTPPTGFVRLNTFNLPTPTIGATAATTANKYFDATLYVGNNAAQTITNAGLFQPDWVWTKARANGYSHNLYDSVRGVNQNLQSNSTGAEFFNANSLTSFNTNGFTLGLNDNGNASSSSVAWQWRASNATAVTNTNGTITSTVSASTTAGFSIVTYTGTGVNATVGHGLGVTPSMFIIKRRNAAGNDWAVYHISTSANGGLALNDTRAYAADSAWFNNTAPTSSVFTVSTSSIANASGATYVAYCFAQIAGYSAFGSYTGNGSADGPFVFTGFRPRFVMFKGSSIASNWCMLDSSRNTYNLTDATLQANDSAAELTNLSDVDFLSNGIKIRDVVTNDTNVSGQTYTYMAFAENPFKYANAR